MITKDIEFIKNLPTIDYIHQETIELSSPFIDIAEKFAREHGSVALLSGGNLDCSRYHILAVKPWLELSGSGDKIELVIKQKAFSLKSCPFDLVGQIAKHFQLSKKQIPVKKNLVPVLSGLFGYFAYDLKNRVENLPQTCVGKGLPDICLYIPSIILIHDKEKTQTDLLIPHLVNDGPDSINKSREFFFKRLKKKTRAIDSDDQISKAEAVCLKSTFSKKEYIQRVNQVIKHLKAGDIYQANLSQCFETEFTSDPFILFKNLYEKNPASFFAYINARTHQIISTSPERFIKREGINIETRPIKGTIARGVTEKGDQENAETLCSSIKDDAELTMIVDLMRNDLSRVAKADSIIVDEHKKLESYDNVFHLAAIVKGILRENKTSVDFLKACFPGGSITGCPKIRAMEIIDELEPIKRHVYTGSLGYLSFHDTMDLSIAIRTAIVFDKKISFSVGGGIVSDSDPEKEYQETLDKGKTIMETLATGSSKIIPQKHSNENNGKIWVNGKVIDKNKASIPIDSPGFQYGAGLFETIKAKNGNIVRLNEHITRLNKGLKQLFNIKPLDINWGNVISMILEKNDLQISTAAVKIMVVKNDENSDFPFWAAVLARKYIPRQSVLKKAGIELIQYPYPRLTPMADHKSLNYFYYYLAGLYAKDNSKDEALILNPDKTISETNTCNLLIIDGDTLILPESEHVLEGVTCNAVTDYLAKKGYIIKNKKVFLEDLFSYSNIILTNSLMGAVPVIGIENKKIYYNKKLLDMINMNIVGF